MLLFLHLFNDYLLALLPFLLRRLRGLLLKLFRILGRLHALHLLLWFTGVFSDSQFFGHAPSLEVLLSRWVILLVNN